MLKKRIIPKITTSMIKLGNIDVLAAVTTKNFERKRVVGNPVSLARIYDKTGADQLLIINKDQLSIAENPAIIELIRKIAFEISMPVCFGGGIVSIADCEKLFYAGIDKVSINSGATQNPKLISDISKIFGAQSVTVCVDYSTDRNLNNLQHPNTYEVTSKKSILDWIKMCQDLGAGEINLSCVSKDGAKSGLDYEFADEVRQHLDIPLLISGGGFSWKHFAKAFTEINVEGVIASTFFAETDQNMVELKNKLIINNAPIRGTLS